MMKTYIVLPDVQIHNANAMSSTYTIGFPAMTAWLGAVHALQRNLSVWDPIFQILHFPKRLLSAIPVIYRFKGVQKLDYRDGQSAKKERRSLRTAAVYCRSTSSCDCNLGNRNEPGSSGI